MISDATIEEICKSAILPSGIEFSLKRNGAIVWRDSSGNPRFGRYRWVYLKRAFVAVLPILISPDFTNHDLEASIRVSSQMLADDEWVAKEKQKLAS